MDRRDDTSGHGRERAASSWSRMGGPSPQQSSMLCLVSLVDRIPRDHPLRPMKKMDRALAELSAVFEGYDSNGSGGVE